MKKHTIVALDFESILVPEIWNAIANEANVEELHLTTRDIPDFDKLMKKRLEAIAKNDLRLKNMQEITKSVKPLKGAVKFLKQLRETYQVVIISDTFYEFIEHLIKKFDYPTLFCNSFEINGGGELTDYYHRNSGGKKEMIHAFNDLGFNVIAVGDSYNDIEMLKAANDGLLFNASDKIRIEYPQFFAFDTYEDLKKEIHGITESKILTPQN